MQSEIQLLPDKVRIGCVKADAIASFTHSLMPFILSNFQNVGFFCFIQTEQNYTIMLDDKHSTKISQNENVEFWPFLWRAITVIGSDGSGAQGLLRNVAGPLAENDVSVFYISTYETDYFLVREMDLFKCCSVLVGHSFLVVDAETELEIDIASLKTKTTHNTEISENNNNEDSNGEVLNNEKRPVAMFNLNLCVASIRKLIHRNDEDSSRYRIMDDSSTLALIELLFYNKSPFFSFSYIEGRISLVMDPKCCEKFSKGTLDLDNTAWRLLKVQNESTIGLGCEETGVVYRYGFPLVTAGLNLYYISAFETDFWLVQDNEIDKACSIFAQENVVIVDVD